MFEQIFLVTERVAVAALGVRIDGEVVFETTACVEEDEVAEAKVLEGPCSWDGENHRGMGHDWRLSRRVSQRRDWQTPKGRPPGWRQLRVDPLRVRSRYEWGHRSG